MQCISKWSALQLNTECGLQALACPLCKQPYTSVLHDCSASYFRYHRYYQQHMHFTKCLPLSICLSPAIGNRTSLPQVHVHAVVMLPLHFGVLSKRSPCPAGDTHSLKEQHLRVQDIPQTLFYQQISFAGGPCTTQQRLLALTGKPLPAAKHTRLESWFLITI